MNNHEKEPTGCMAATEREQRQFIERDPLEITPEMVQWAEHPELADPRIGLLPERKFSLRKEREMRKRWKLEAQRLRLLAPASAIPTERGS